MSYGHDRQSRYGSPVALTPQVTAKTIDDGAVIEGNTMPPVPCNAAMVVDAAVGQLAAPIAAVQVTEVHDRPAAAGSFRIAPTTVAPAVSDTVTV